jgi:zinc/manganese transport system ATP-binding protein
MTAAERTIELVDAGVRRGGRDIWAHVDVGAAPGEFVAVLGPNGSGKSTLLNVVLGLLPLRTGSATVLGERPGAARAQIGYLPQRGGVQDSVRVRGVDLVRLGLDGTRWGIPVPGTARSRASRARVDEVIELVGAGAYSRRPVGELSGGERQRLLIAQALVREPRILLLDEPLDSLDLPNQTAIASLVQRICASEGVTVVLVAHDVNPILGYLDRVIYFAGGRAAQGTPAEVINSRTLSELYGVPIEVLETSDGRRVVVGSPEPPALHHARHGH